MMKKWSALGGLAFAAILGSVFAFPAYAKEKTFPDGIYAGDFALGGLTKEQAVISPFLSMLNKGMGAAHSGL